jgi:hypothetical protein
VRRVSSVVCWAAVPRFPGLWLGGWWLVVCCWVWGGLLFVGLFGWWVFLVGGGTGGCRVGVYGSSLFECWLWAVFG